MFSFKILENVGSVAAKSGLAVSCGGILSYFGYKDKTRYSRMLERYKKGYIFPLLCHNPDDYLRRQTLEGEMSQLIRQECTNNYNVISGEVGTGKTCLVESIQQEIQTNGAKGQGAPIYVTVSQGTSLADSLANAVNFSFDEHMNLPFLVSCLLQIQNLPSKESENKLPRVLAAIERSSYQYKQKYKRSAVIIVDSLDMLYQEDPKSVKLLQRKARLWADTDVCKVVFVCNDQRTIEALQENKSYWGRAGQTLHVGDLEEEDAVNYLLQKLPSSHYNGHIPDMNIETASYVYGILGGRIQHLKMFKDHYYRGHTIQKALNVLTSREREKFSRESEIPRMWKAITLLRGCSGESIPLSEMLRSVPKETVNDLVDCDIFMFERSQLGILVRFQSPLTKYTVEKMDIEYLGRMDKLKAKDCWWKTVMHFIKS